MKTGDRSSLSLLRTAAVHVRKILTFSELPFLHLFFSSPITITGYMRQSNYQEKKKCFFLFVCFGEVFVVVVVLFWFLTSEDKVSLCTLAIPEVAL